MAQHGNKARTFYSQFISANDLCFDVGANVGARTRIFVSLGASVVAIEPQPACVASIRKSFGQDNRVIVVPKALGSAEGEAEMFISNVSTLSSMNQSWIRRVQNSGRFARYRWPKKVKVPVTTLDHLIRQYGAPVFCKIDVEGYEVEVLRGLSHPINAVGFEFTHEMIESTYRCIEILSALGSYRFNYSLGESMEMALKTWVDAGEIGSVLAGLKGRLLWGDVYARLK